MGLFARLGKAMTWLFTPTGSQQPETHSGLSKAINWLFTPTGSQQKLQINTSSQPVKIPAHASHRINSQKQVGVNFFTSDLSCNEYLLTRQDGWEPIGVVMGTCFYKVGFFGYFRGYQKFTGELTALTQAQLAARELAVSRMQLEAAMLGAHGIIGVRLKKSRAGWGVGMIEFTAVGTAIRLPGRPPEPKPFTSDLSGQDFWTLLRAGYRPLGLVMGNCVYHVAYQGLGQWFKNIGKNVEMTNFTQALYDARELAMERMQVEAALNIIYVI